MYVNRCYKTFKIQAKDNDSVCQAITKLFKKLGDKADEVFKSITFDNGLEFADMTIFEKQSDIYYTHPYSSYERGSNERHNGLLRRFIPKGKSISDYDSEEIMYFSDIINAMPRKILGYRTPEELFDEEMDKIYRID